MALVLEPNQCFSHGQVYVAFLRVTSIDGIRVYTPHTYKPDGTYIVNIVFPELLDNATPRDWHEPPNIRAEIRDEFESDDET